MSAMGATTQATALSEIPPAGLVPVAGAVAQRPQFPGRQDLATLATTTITINLHDACPSLTTPVTGYKSTVLVLQEHRERRERDWALLRIPIADDSLVFCQPDGRPLHPNAITRARPMLAARAGLRVIRFHDAHHTHASLILRQNVHPKVVQERLGHATISVTLDTYSHVAPGLQEAAARNFDNLGLLADNKAAERVH